MYLKYKIVLSLIAAYIKHNSRKSKCRLLKYNPKKLNVKWKDNLMEDVHTDAQSINSCVEKKRCCPAR